MGSLVHRIRGRLSAVAVTVLGVSLVAGQSYGHAAAGTTVGGVVASDTEWTAAGSPYIATSTVQVPAGITLTIDPGVTVEGRVSPDSPFGSVFVARGTISAVGTAGDPVRIDSGDAALLGTGVMNGSVTLQHAVLHDGGIVFGGPLRLLDSFVYGMGGAILETGGNVIEGNVFDHSGGFQLWNGGGSGTSVVDGNRFETASLGRSWVLASGAGTADVNGNSFDAPGTSAVALDCDFPGASLDATSNYWGTTSTSVIASMITDDHDNISCAGCIPYEPALNGPAPGTPEGIFVSTAAPAIHGTVKVGSAVTATAGMWEPALGVALSYQWKANGTPFSGATRSSFTIPAALAGKRLTVSVTAGKAGYSRATADSSARTVAKGTLTVKARPTLSGTPQAGHTLTVTKGNWTPAPTVTVQWYANGRAIARATGVTLKLTQALKGKVMSVTVTASKAGYVTAAVTLKETKKVQ